MKPFKNKSLILAITNDVGIYSCIVDNLEFLGFTVYLVTFQFQEKFKYKSIWSKIYSAFSRHVLGDKTYKLKLKAIYYRDKMLDCLSEIPKTDFSLTIRVDLFDEEVLKKIIDLSSKSYAYHWDGLERHNVSSSLIPLYDKFYVFDKKDLNLQYKTYLITNFYFDCYDFLNEKSKLEFDVFYVGACDKRINRLIPICEYLKDKGYNLNINLSDTKNKYMEKYSYINCLSSLGISYIDNLKLVSKSRCLIDIHHEKLHAGLSFRVFESLGNEKKLITTNPIVKEYDFYDPNNILSISGDEDLSKIDAFLKSDYKPLALGIKKKYSFSNWIGDLLETKED